MNALKIQIFARMGHARICWERTGVSVIMVTRSTLLERFAMISMNVKLTVCSAVEVNAKILLEVFR